MPFLWIRSVYGYVWMQLVFKMNLSSFRLCLWSNVLLTPSTLWTFNDHPLGWSRPLRTFIWSNVLLNPSTLWTFNDHPPRWPRPLGTFIWSNVLLNPSTFWTFNIHLDEPLLLGLLFDPTFCWIRPLCGLLMIILPNEPIFLGLIVLIQQVVESVHLGTWFSSHLMLNPSTSRTVNYHPLRWTHPLLDLYFLI